MPANLDPDVIEGFGDEWSRFAYEQSSEELRKLFEAYFAVFPWQAIESDAAGFDLGCGTGRWARLVAPRVGRLHLIDASDAALSVARRNLRDATNVVFHHATVDEIPLADDSMDFGYSLGVLHHVPDTPAAIRSAVRKLRPGAPLLLYLYYALDNRPAWFRGIWRASDIARRGISRLPHPLRFALSQAIAGGVYWPLARLARVAERAGVAVERFPLSYYRERSFYVMRTDALDRFGTRLERRFTREEVRAMLREAGLRDVVVGDEAPFWCAVGYRER